MKEEIQKNIENFLQEAKSYSDTPVDQSFNLIEFIRLTFDLIQQIEIIKSAKNVVFLIGNTGAGKSTTINYLHGCQFDLIKTETGPVYQARNDSCQFIAKQGHNITKSETLYPYLYKGNLTNINYCDLPGLYDSRGLVHKLAAAIGIDLVIKVVESIQGFLIVISHGMMITDKTLSFRKALDNLVATIGNIEAIKDSLIFIFTRISRDILDYYDYNETVHVFKKIFQERLRELELQQQEIEPFHCDLIEKDSFSEENIFKDLPDKGNQFIYVLAKQGFYFLDRINEKSKLLLNTTENFENFRDLSTHFNFKCRKTCTNLSWNDLGLIKKYSSHSYCIDKMAEIDEINSRFNRTKALLEYAIKNNRFLYVDLNNKTLSKKIISDINSLQQYRDRTSFRSFLQGQLKTIFDIITHHVITEGKDICQSRHELVGNFSRLNQSIENYKREKGYRDFFRILQTISQVGEDNFAKLCDNEHDSCRVTIQNVVRINRTIASIKGRIDQLTNKTQELKNNNTFVNYTLQKVCEPINITAQEEVASVIISVFSFCIGFKLVMSILEYRKQLVDKVEDKNLEYAQWQVKEEDENLKEAQQRVKAAKKEKREAKERVNTAVETENRVKADWERVRKNLDIVKENPKDDRNLKDVQQRVKVENENLKEAQQRVEEAKRNQGKVQELVKKNKEAAEKSFRNYKIIAAPLMLVPAAIIYLKSKEYMEEGWLFSTSGWFPSHAIHNNKTNDLQLYEEKSENQRITCGFYYQEKESPYVNATIVITINGQPARTLNVIRDSDLPEVGSFKAHYVCYKKTICNSSAWLTMQYNNTPQAKAENYRLGEEIKCLEPALEKNNKNLSHQIEALKLELLPSLMIKLNKTIGFLQKRTGTNNIDYNDNTDLFNLTLATQNLSSHNLSEFVTHYEKAKNVPQEQINSILIFKLDNYTHDTRYFEWVNFFSDNQHQNTNSIRKKENIISSMKKYVYPLGEDYNSFTEPSLDSNKTNTDFCTISPMDSLHSADLAASTNLLEIEQTVTDQAISVMKSSAIHGVIRGTSNVIAKAATQRKHFSDSTSTIMSEGFYYTAMFLMNTAYYYLQHNQNAIHDAAKDTSTLLFINVILNRAFDQVVKKAAREGWKQSAQFFKKAASYGVYAYNIWSKGYVASGASILTGMATQTIVEKMGERLLNLKSDSQDDTLGVAAAR